MKNSIVFKYKAVNYLLCISFLFCSKAWSQQDSAVLIHNAILDHTDTSIKSAIVINPIKRHGFGWRDSVLVPKRSALYSMLFPGLGQLNNQQYWKLPIVYGLVGASIYFFQDNIKNYNKYRKIQIDRKNGVYTDEYYGIYTDDNIVSLRNQYKKYLDMTALLTALGYGLQIMDANVSAHLKGFDISEDLSFKIKPSVQPTPFGLSSGIGVAFIIK